jgi:hypothetical protein
VTVMAYWSGNGGDGGGQKALERILIATHSWAEQGDGAACTCACSGIASCACTMQQVRVASERQTRMGRLVQGSCHHAIVQVMWQRGLIVAAMWQQKSGRWHRRREVSQQ